MVAFINFEMSISEPFKELQGWNLEFILFSPKPFNGTHLGGMLVILDFLKGNILAALGAVKLEI